MNTMITATTSIKKRLVNIINNSISTNYTVDDISAIKLGLATITVWMEDNSIHIINYIFDLCELKY